MTAAACTSSSSSGSTCSSAGGRCVLGGAPCSKQAATSAASPSPRSRLPSRGVRAGADPPRPRSPPTNRSTGSFGCPRSPKCQPSGWDGENPAQTHVFATRSGPRRTSPMTPSAASCPVSLGYATDTSPAARRSTRLRQYGGPRAGARAGASVDSPRRRRKRRTDAASVTSATRRMLPPQRGHARTSIAKQRLRSSAQGRYRDPARFAGFSASAATAGRGTIFGRSLLAGASTPA